MAQGEAIITAQTSNPDVSASCTVVVSDAVITPQYQLTVTTSGSGSVTIDPEGGTYDEGTEVTLTAVPDENYLFDGWSGDVDDTATTITLEMDADKDIVATFSAVSGCGSYTEVSVPITIDGEGEYCYKTAENIGYINSWDADVVEVNGTDYTNSYVSSLPDKIDGYYKIYYKGSYSWSHFEAGTSRNLNNSTSSVDQLAQADNATTKNVTAIYPNPFNNSLTIQIKYAETVENITVMDQLGSVVSVLDKSDISTSTTFGSDLDKGLYIITVRSTSGSETFRVLKK
jgi:hypothetical protein